MSLVKTQDVPVAPLLVTVYIPLNFAFPAVSFLTKTVVNESTNEADCPSSVKAIPPPAAAYVSELPTAENVDNAAVVATEIANPAWDAALGSKKYLKSLLSVTLLTLLRPGAAPLIKDEG